MRNPGKCLFAATVVAVLFATCGAAETVDLSGIYWAAEYHPKIQIVGGGDLPFTFFRAQLHLRDGAAQILVTLARFHEQRIAPAFRRGDLRTDVRLDLDFVRGLVKTRRTVDTIAIEHGHRRHLALGAQSSQFFRIRRALKKAERRSRMKFGVLQS